MWRVTETFLYFVYGSNLAIRQMTERCPGAEVVGTGYLPGHALCFPRMSVKRNCGVSSVEPMEGAAVWGAVYRLTAVDLALLDQKEGYQPGRNRNLNSYTRLPVMVTMNGRGNRNADLLCRTASRDVFAEHGLPQAYSGWRQTSQAAG